MTAWLAALLQLLSGLFMPTPHETGQASRSEERQPLPQPQPPDPSAVWGRVAACESGGNWHISTGNGFYGGLQFTLSTWAGFGGRAYAARADLATPAQQVLIAKRVLLSQGVVAWPICGPRAGLSLADAR